MLQEAIRVALSNTFIMPLQPKYCPLSSLVLDCPTTNRTLMPTNKAALQQVVMFIHFGLM